MRNTSASRIGNERPQISWLSFSIDKGAKQVLLIFMAYYEYALFIARKMQVRQRARAADDGRHISAGFWGISQKFVDIVQRCMYNTITLEGIVLHYRMNVSEIILCVSEGLG